MLLIKSGPSNRRALKAKEVFSAKRPSQVKFLREPRNGIKSKAESCRKNGSSKMKIWKRYGLASMKK
jgi:hypothetical protein